MFGLQISAKKLMMVTGVIIVPLVLSGCVGSSTYGTGKTSAEHLVDGLGGFLGSPEPKAPIDYSTRPDLVEPPKSASLPQPVEGGTSTSELPENPEQRRARLLAEAPVADERSDQLPIEFLKKRRSADSTVQRVPSRIVSRSEFEDNAAYDDRRKRNRRIILKRRAELAGARGAAPRKYLTEPKREYRTPADTAPIGEIGIDEDTKARKAKGKKRWSWRDLNPFG